MSTHYQKGDKSNKIAFVFSCPGNQEEKAKMPAAGVTGNNLNIVLNILQKEHKTKFGEFLRNHITITNATSDVQSLSTTNKTQASKKDISATENISRLTKELRGKQLIFCCGINAQNAVDLLLSQKRLKSSCKIIRNIHLCQRNINRIIKEDITGTRIKKGQAGNTEKRLRVWVERIRPKLET